MVELKISKASDIRPIEPYEPSPFCDVLNGIRKGFTNSEQDWLIRYCPTIASCIENDDEENKGSYEKQVKKEEIKKDTRTTVEDGMMYTTFRLYNNGEQSCVVNVPKVESVQFYNGGKVAKVTFADGHFEKAVLKATTPEELEEERKEAAIAICLLKHTVAHGNHTLGYGSNIYNKWMERILKQYKKAEEAKKAEVEKKEADKERKKRIAEKKARKKERRLSRLNEGNENK